MPPQHEPPANGTASSVAVRRAVAVPAPGEDPGADLGPRTPDSAAPVPIPSSPEPAPRRLRGWRARSAAAEQQEPASAEQQQQPEQQQARQQQESASSEPQPEPEPEAGLGALLAGNGDGANGADEAEPAGAPPGRPRGPMLAAAAIAGAVLIAVPFLVLGLSDDDDGDRTVNTASIGGMTLDPGMSDDEVARDYAVESPSPSASPTDSPSPSPSKSASSGSVAGVEVKAAPQPSVTKSASPKAKATKTAAPTTRQLVNALSNRANVLLKNVATSRCADLPGSGKGKSGGSVNQHSSCVPDNRDNQLWDLKVTDSDGGPEGSSLFVIKNRKDGLCMDLPYYSNVAPETKITEHHCDGSNSDNQLWWLDPRPEGYWIRNVASNMCMGVTGGRSAKDNAHLQVVKCGDTSLSAQRWIISQVVKP